MTTKNDENYETIRLLSQENTNLMNTDESLSYHIDNNNNENEECLPLRIHEQETTDTLEISPSIRMITTSSPVLNQSLSDPMTPSIHKRKSSRLKEVKSSLNHRHHHHHYTTTTSTTTASSTSKKKPHRTKGENKTTCFESTTSNLTSILDGSAEQTRRRCGMPNQWCDGGTSGGFWKGTMHIMNILARIVLWGSIAAMAAGCIWYSRELAYNGTDPHLIAWFSAGAFVLLGFPISMYGIFMHLSNYYQPNIQCYVVRILWMVPIYSIESWLCLRFHEFAIYIETLRDCYESYVLYCFLHYLIEVLGGEEELTLILKDKSPTRGVHFSPLYWCCKPWIMGQPTTRVTPLPSDNNESNNPPLKYIQWRSPFYIKCKFGVLQYVLLKNIMAVLTMVLELHGLYNEGDFSPKTGYLYICIITNTSQCWALYCLAFFYYATKNELSPIRPVGKFLSVKAIVFFTWWQSLFISILYQMNFIPDYNAQRPWSAEAVAKGLQDYLICIEMFIGAIVHVFVFPHTDYISGGLSRTRSNDSMSTSSMNHKIHRLGKKNKMFHHHNRKRTKSPPIRKNRRNFQLELLTCDESIQITGDTETATLPDRAIEIATKPCSSSTLRLQKRDHFDNNLELEEACLDDIPSISSSCSSHESETPEQGEESEYNNIALLLEEQPELQPTGFIKAFLDSTMPRDVVDNTFGIVQGQYKLEKKTLLHHATTSDEYDLFSKRKKQQQKKVLLEGTDIPIV